MKKILMKKAKKWDMTIKEYIIACIIKYSINLIGILLITNMFCILIYNYLFGEIYM